MSGPGGGRQDPRAKGQQKEETDDILHSKGHAEGPILEAVACKLRFGAVAFQRF